MQEPPAKTILDRLHNSALVRFLLLFACGWAIVQILEYFETVIVIFTFAAIVAFLLSYPVRWLHRYLPHGVAVTLVFVLGMGSLAGIALAAGITIASQGQQLIESLTAFVNSLGPLGERLENFLQ